MTNVIQFKRKPDTGMSGLRNTYDIFIKAARTLVPDGTKNEHEERYLQMVEILKGAYVSAIKVEIVPDNINLLFQLVAPLLLDFEPVSEYGDLAIMSFYDAIKLNYKE